MTWARATLQVNFDPGQDFFFWCENKDCRLVCRPCNFTSGNLNKTSVREKFRAVYPANRLSFYELFDDISLVLKRQKIMRG